MIRSLICVIFLGSITLPNAQTGSNPKPVDYNVDMYPKTPEAAALSKFVDIPAGNYTGVADFTIPLYTIDLDGEKIPIELKYTTTGITVGQIATRVGLGWILNTGPSLSQQVIGVQDKTFPRPVLSQYGLQPNPGNDNPGSDYDIAMRASGLRRNGVNPLDIKPDIFTYNLLSNSGKFILSADGSKGIPMPYNQISIIPSDYFGQMNITDEKGFKYVFTNPYGTLKTKNSCAEDTVDPEFDFHDPNFRIGKIVSTKNKEVKYLYNLNINAKYVNSVTTQARISLTIPVPPPHGPQPYHNFMTKCANYTLSMDSPLTEIQFEGGKAQFFYNSQNNNPRLDVNGEVFLTSVIVKNDKDETIKSFTLNYDYFNSPEVVPSATGIFTYKGDYLPGMNKRLKLVSVRDNLTSGTYSFEYYESYGGKTLPYRISNNQDYWGVYNGANNGEKAISLSRYEQQVDLNAPNTAGIDLIGANKNPDINFGKLGSLKKIKYPTGGYSEIEYEADDFDISDFPEVIYDYSQEQFSYFVNDDLYPPKREQFTIPSKAINQTISFAGRPNVGSSNTIGPCTWNLKKLPNGTITTGQVSGTFSRNDPPGEYEIWVERDQDLYPNVKCSAEYFFTQLIATPVDTIYSKKAGNIRVSKIESFDDNGGKITREYTYKVPTVNHVPPYTKTSGVNQGEELFMSLGTQKYPIDDNNGTVVEVIASNNPGWQTTTVRGKAVGYSYVQEYYVDHTTPSNSYRKEYRFKNEKEPQYHDPSSTTNITWKNNGLDRGLLLEELLFDSDGNFVRKTANEYEYDGYFNNKYSANSPFGPKSMGYGLEIVPTKRFGATGVGYGYSFDSSIFVLNNYWVREKTTTTTEYANNGQDSLQVVKTFNYSIPDYRHTYPAETLTVGSLGEKLKTVNKYPADIPPGDPQYGVMQGLIAKNRLSDPVIIKTLTENVATSEVKTIYDQFNSGSEAMILPKYIYLKKGENSTAEDSKITYDSYDVKGNLTQYTLESGIPVAVIWGYNKTQPVAKIEGALFEDIKGNYLVADVVNAAENDNTPVQGMDAEQTEQALIVALDNLRKNDLFKNYQVTTYTYDPLVGVRSVTPPSGIREYYFYDDSKRLQSIKIREKNSSGIEVFKILKEYKYNYKP